MLIIMDARATPEQCRAVEAAVEAAGHRSVPVPGASRTAICLVGNDGRLAVPLRVRGALTAPRIDVDLGRVADNKLRGGDTEKKVKGLLRGLLGKKDDD